MLWTYNVRLLYLDIATLRSDLPERVDTAEQAAIECACAFVIRRARGMPASADRAHPRASLRRRRHRAARVFITVSRISLRYSRQCGQSAR